MNLVTLTGRVVALVHSSPTAYSLRLRLFDGGDLLVVSPTPAQVGTEIFVAGQLLGRKSSYRLAADSLIAYRVEALVADPGRPKVRGQRGSVQAHSVASHQRTLASGRTIWVRPHRRGDPHV